ncbi:MAG TPA: excinuclease ABC subunit UvrC [Syntrophales bacterium]|nr:excinuclease ABC subunit UvrC [Syntrophales bacterium]
METERQDKTRSEAAEALDRKIKAAPARPGVYLMKDDRGEVIYVGKAKNLRNRIRNYFQGTDTRAMVPFLVSRVRDLDFVVTGTEKEAFLLENTLIKEHRPRYNVIFRDDKTYFSLRLDTRQDFPAFQLVRKTRKDGARYFGPYPSGLAAKETLKYLHQLFPLRTCKDREFKTRRRPCIEYEIRKCVGPCVGLAGKEQYRKFIDDAVLFLEGRGTKLLDLLKKRMAEAAENLEFEEAARLRDRIAAIEATVEKQRMVSPDFKDRDVFGLYREEDQVQVCILRIREGKTLGTKKFAPVRTAAADAEVLSSLLGQYYDGELFIPAEVVIPEEIEDGGVLAEWLSEKRGKRVELIVPRRGPRRDLVAIARQNAEDSFKAERAVRMDEEAALALLRDKLHLHRLPRRIECVDISNLGGELPVGALVSFLDGRPDKSGYRLFHVRGVEGPDDYASMHEVLQRRFEGRDDLPDLLMVDGGRGQVGMAVKVLRELEIGNLDVIGLAKGSPPAGEAGGARRRPSMKEQDHVYLAGRKDPVYLHRHPAALLLLQRIRDEAHRFAITHHRRRLEKRNALSVLDGVPGVGAAKKKALLRRFGDLDALRRAGPEDLVKVPGITAKLAGAILRHLNPPDRS